MRIIQPQCSTEIGKISVENSIPTYNGIVLKFYGDSIFSRQTLIHQMLLI